MVVVDESPRRRAEAVGDGVPLAVLQVVAGTGAGDDWQGRKTVMSHRWGRNCRPTLTSSMTRARETPTMKGRVGVCGSTSAVGRTRDEGGL